MENKQCLMWGKQATDLDEHKPLHGLIPLQQDDARLQRSTQVLVACVRVSHYETDGKETSRRVIRLKHERLNISEWEHDLKKVTNI